MAVSGAAGEGARFKKWPAAARAPCAARAPWRATRKRGDDRRRECRQKRGHKDQESEEGEERENGWGEGGEGITVALAIAAAILAELDLKQFAQSYCARSLSSNGSSPC
jgi:hypothetical protein